MATKCNNTLGTLTTGSPGSYLMADGSGSLTWSIQNDNMVDFVEFALEIMGIDLKYSEFTKMSDVEKIAFIRDLKIKKILD